MLPRVGNESMSKASKLGRAVPKKTSQGQQIGVKKHQKVIWGRAVILCRWQRASREAKEAPVGAPQGNQVSPLR